VKEDPGYLRGTEVDVRSLIERRGDQRIKEGLERPAEAAWAAAVKAHNRMHAADLRIAWFEWHLAQADRHHATMTAIIKQHEEAAAKLEPGLPRDYPRPRRGAA